MMKFLHDKHSVIAYSNFRFVPIIWIINIIKQQYYAKKIDSVQMDMLLKQVVSFSAQS